MQAMITCEQVSRIIEKWSSQNGARFSCGVGGFPQEHCFAYVSNSHGERCQVVVETPVRGIVTVRIRELESIGADQLSDVWRVTISELATTLDTAAALIDKWFARHADR